MPKFAFENLHQITDKSNKLFKQFLSHIKGVLYQAWINIDWIQYSAHWAKRNVWIFC